MDKTEKIWSKFNAGLKLFIINKIKDKSLAEDILQEVFIKIHLKIDTLKDETKLKSWLYQITRNIIIDHYRRNNQANNINFTVTEASDSHNDIKLMEEAARDMIKMMDDLPAEYCEALCIIELEGLSQKEYSLKTGIPYSSAKSRVQRSKRMLKDMLMKCCHYQFDKYGTILSISPHTCCCCNSTRSF